jgi:hypothetical protein
MSRKDHPMPHQASTPQRLARKSKRRSPIFYSPELGERICERLAAGERWHNMAGKPGLPTHATIYKWADDHPAFGAAFALAKRAGADGRADRALNVAEAATKESLPVDRFHVGTLKWTIERDDKAYGRRKDEPDLGAGRRLIVEMRQFERVVREDGTAFVREILPSGETIDL